MSDFFLNFTLDPTAPYGAGTPLFPLSIYFLIFPLFYFSLSLYWLYLFSSFVHPFPYYQNSLTPFPGRRSYGGDRTWV